MMGRMLESWSEGPIRSRGRVLANNLSTTFIAVFFDSAALSPLRTIPKILCRQLRLATLHPRRRMAIVAPEGYRLHNENGAKLLLPPSDDAFLNPVQEFNRDLSVAAIRVWSEQLNEIKEKRWREKGKRAEENGLKPSAKKRRKDSFKSTTDPPDGKELPNNIDDNEDITEAISSNPMTEEPSTVAETPDEPKKTREYIPQKVVILEPLSATGLRSIRYAQEIPLVKYVIANDLSPSATEIMKRNVKFNGLGPEEPATESTETNTEVPASSSFKAGVKPHLGRVRVNEGDACALMYSHRAERNRVDVVDLDPYGTAAPFIDAAVQCVNDGGLLCVTCTDLSVLGNTNYPEKCFANYGGVPVKAEYCHEAALRLVLHTISTSAARYGRYIHPLISLSIDFYVRMFVRVHAAPIEVKKTFSKTSIYYICSGCQSFHAQPLGRVVEKINERSGNKNLQYKTNAGPTVTQECEECGGTFHVAGPMWSGAIHDRDFTTKLLNHVESDKANYGTSLRMKGMITVAGEELDTPFYFTPSKIAGFFHCTSPSLEEVASALIHAGHAVSRSHACPGSIKTSATRKVVHDVFRSHVKLHPVKMENVKEGSPAIKLLAKPPSFEANFKRHPEASALSSVKLVRYQHNPTSHWGPGTKAGSKKRKLTEE